MLNANLTKLLFYFDLQHILNGTVMPVQIVKQAEVKQKYKI